MEARKKSWREVYKLHVRGRVQTYVRCRGLACVQGGDGNKRDIVSCFVPSSFRYCWWRRNVISLLDLKLAYCVSLVCMQPYSRTGEMEYGKTKRASCNERFFLVDKLWSWNALYKDYHFNIFLVKLLLEKQKKTLQFNCFLSALCVYRNILWLSFVL